MLRSSRIFLYSLFFSRLGDQALLFIVPLVIFQLTESVELSGTAFFFETLLRFLSFPVCGILCDRYGTYTLMRMSQFYRAVICFAGIALYFVFGGIVWLILISVLCGILTTQGLMAREAMLPQLFHGVKFEQTASYTQIADQIGTILGPVLAALLLQYSSWESVVLFSGLCFIIGDRLFKCWFGCTKPVLTKPDCSEREWLAPILQVIQIVRTTQELKLQIALAWAVNLVLGVTLATSAVMITGVYAASQNIYACVQITGAIATVMVLYPIVYALPTLKVMGILSCVVIFVGGIFTGIGGNPIIYATGFVLIIGFDKMFNVFIRTVRKEVIPKKDFGKTTGLIVLLNNMPQPISGLLVALLAASVTTENIILIATGLSGAVFIVSLLRMGR